jgi:hypothetical protein
MNGSSHAGSSASEAPELKSYSVRVQKLDGQNVTMSGSLPGHARLQDLADAIVQFGHAEALSFRILFPGQRPPRAYAPHEFEEPLGSCGVFQGRVLMRLEALPESSRSPSLLPQHPWKDSLRRLCDFGGFTCEMTVRALRQADGNEELAMNLLLDQVARNRIHDDDSAKENRRPQHDVQQPQHAVQQFFWGRRFHDLAQAFSRGHASETLLYSRFLDCYTGKLCLRLRTESAYWAHLFPFHLCSRALHHFQQLFRAPKMLIPRAVPPLDPRSELLQDARLRVCGSATGEKVALALCGLSVQSKSDFSMAAVRGKAFAAMIVRRMHSVSCSRIQVTQPSVCEPLCMRRVTCAAHEAAFDIVTNDDASSLADPHTPPPPTPQSSAEVFSRSACLPLVCDAREAIRRNDIDLAKSLVQLSQELLEFNHGWELQAMRDIADNCSHWRTHSHLRNPNA